MNDHIYAFWCRIPSRANFGDALTPWLVEKITGQYPKFRHANDKRHKYVVTGSVLGALEGPSTVWGAGVMNASDELSSEINAVAVRGPLSHAALTKAGAKCALASPLVYGDPALLLPSFYTPRKALRYKVGLALHFSDFPRITANYPIPDDVNLIDLQQPVERVIDEICCCETIASSSLHGLIVSHAYGIPASWIEFKPLPSGDGSKFVDYLMSVGRATTQPSIIDPNQLTIDKLQARLIAPPSSFDRAALLECCPLSRNAS